MFRDNDLLNVVTKKNLLIICDYSLNINDQHLQKYTIMYGNKIIIVKYELGYPSYRLQHILPQILLIYHLLTCCNLSEFYDDYFYIHESIHFNTWLKQEYESVQTTSVVFDSTKY